MGTPHALGLAELGVDQLVPVILMIAGVLLLVIALRRGVGYAPAKPNRGELPQASPPTTDELNRTMRDARELAGLLASQMDRQAARLEGLIVEADERIRKLERLSAAAEAPRAKGEKRGDGADPLAKRVFDLADQGLPPVEIARSLSQQTGKVELILALRGR